MPRRRGGSPSPRRSPAPARRAPVPYKPPANAVAQPAPQAPGIMGQMAATAGGVAAGHVIGHAITGAISGGSGAAEPVVAQQQYEQQNPCQYQMDEFMQCSKNQYDLTMCTAFRDALNDCKRSYG